MRARAFCAGGAAALTTMLLLGCGGARQSLASRQADVAARGAQVMPFDLSKTRHVFESLPDGGLQTVTALDAGDTLQVRLIREHLQDEAARFARGDFEDPMAIHGHAMPGIAELRRDATRLGVAYAPVPGGATIRYRSDEPSLVAALHTWFEAQRMDHGAAGKP